jgi:23S rRNA (cytidine1920-2'-O)/16S rRNA (cytidine1409-2'-O)-methyltransferase
VNARALTGDDVPHPVDLVTIDVAFISLRHIFPALPNVIAAHADVIALVKPQFEAGRNEVGKGGIVRDPQVRARVVDEVTAAADRLGLRRAGLAESPIEGMEGNTEFLLLLRRD